MDDERLDVGAQTGHGIPTTALGTRRAGAPSAPGGVPAAPDGSASSGEGGRFAELIGVLTDRLPLNLPDRSRKDADAPAGDTERPGRSRATGTFLTYAQTAFDTFAERPLCELDSIVFSWLSYYRLSGKMRASWHADGMPLHVMLRAEEFDQMFGTSWDPAGSRDLLFAVCASPRFRASRLVAFDFKTDQATAEQFAAMTFLLPGGGAYVAFRGTDSTLVGWREDFNMASLCPVPAQREAHEYLERVAALVDGPLYVGGHSKGGNLAVYAAACVSRGVQDRIVRVFSHDGPGFPADFLTSAGYRCIRGRVEKTVPKSSIIGLIMDTERDFDVVESDGVSVLQHNPFLWAVEGNAFRRADGLSASSRYLSSTVTAWMNRFTPEERGTFIDTLFSVIDVTGAVRMADIREDWRESLPAMRDAYDALAPEQRAFVVDVLRALARVATIDRLGSRDN
ncbi:DUF2974 domain-containing protein [Collinsella tanakaei]|nr:DUF2974 domain-containing protein [Collinsella tanakaei]